MQPLNDDMDNLFREAAENYSLSSHGASFDKVQQQLSEANPPAPPEKKRRRFLWLLLLLIPIPFVYEHHQSNYASAKNENAQHSANVAKENPLAASNTQQTNTGTNTILTDKDITGAKDTEFTTPTAQPLQQQTNSTANRQSIEKTAVADTKHTQPTGSNTTWGKVDYSTKKSIREKVDVSIYSPAIAGGNINDKNQQHSTDAGLPTSKKSNNTLPGNENESDATAKQLIPNSTPLLADSSRATDSTNNALAKQTDTTKQSVAQKQKTTDSTNTVAKKKDKKTDRQPLGFFYIGGVAGTDISAVKSPDTHGLGYNAGFVVGYRYRKHLAIESGLIWNYKKYYADGKYVSVDKLDLQMHTMVLNIDGTCGMFEIPLTVQYHFGNTDKSHFYAATGLSSYLMKNEEYYYLYRRYGTQYYAEKDYKNSIQNWFSVLQLSAGYQLQLGKKSTLRFEPYVKLPMSKIGIAQMPLSSAGINIGYILPLK